MRPRTVLPFALVLSFLVLATTGVCQSQPGPTHYVWALDTGPSGGVPVIRVYTPSGTEVAVLSNLPGSGMARALDFDRSGDAWLCRGDAVYKWDAATGTFGSLVLQPPSGASQAMDIQQVPALSGEIMVSWGATQAASAVSWYDTSSGTPAVPVSSISAGLDHPRRIATSADPASGLIYVANRGSQEIVEFDYTVAAPTVSVVRSLMTEDIGPVGLCYDAPNNGLWVAGDWGNTNEIGCIELGATGSPYNTAIMYPPAGVAGLTSPSGLFYDRFRRLYVAGRDRNSGTPGVYVFAADSPTVAPSFASFYPRSGSAAPGSIIDVTIQPAMTDTCAPTEGTDRVLVMGQNNRVTFSAPELAGPPTPIIYAAALSAQWPTACGASFVAGTLDGSLLFAGGDPRGIPATPDFLFWGTVAVPAPGVSLLTPPPPFVNDLSPLVNITGFIGTLDASGTAEAFVDLTNFTDPLNTNGFNGLPLSLCWLTFDQSEPSLFGYVAEPLCLTLRNPETPGMPVTAIPCP